VPRIGSFIADSRSVARPCRDRMRQMAQIALVKSAAMDGRFVIFAFMD
jgi:hypothetical protein